MMSYRLTLRDGMKSPQTACVRRALVFKEHDSCCCYSSFKEGGAHA